MTNDSRYILLEYNQQQGLFHHNSIYNGRFNSEPNTYGWEPIALTLESKASLFCNIADAVQLILDEKGITQLLRGKLRAAETAAYFRRYSLPDCACGHQTAHNHYDERRASVTC